ncbi:TlpA disulfide reductase family protein [Flavilitoribacter nigricans]|uniref:Thioredoxin domain-containing protein n=1 Tax=Flavilitoribacter nigricans (strain ATCC 23147 / DSM 23189 / NBRC 102662 / NCIMB 1420 / SS-2) TaxID=1122177 RepID=A0A2D0NDL7_FLAN2|nr:TlpA disulfide reductase family protein [Flavilitoribacter nigricans]PHN06498.1 hypothetical protein CRP01_09320 [Flavilitoribacter nigricans DSM 23189 = NBRC 102662]
MKILKLACLLLLTAAPFVLTAQSAEEVVEQYQNSLEKIQSLAYDVRQLDTFVSGHVWDYPGQVVLIREENDPVLGFHFMASKGEIERGALYDGSRMFELKFEPKTYELESRPGPHMMGAAAAQLVVPEMMAYQDTVQPVLSTENELYVLTYHFPDLTEYGVAERKKVIQLDQRTYLPVKVVSSQVSLGKKQVITRFISNVEINKEQHLEKLDKTFLENFEPEVQEDRKNLHQDLLSTTVKDIEFRDFTGKSVSLQAKKGKVILLDFWEVWCGPCRQSMPEVQALHDQYRTEGLEVIAILMDKDSQDSAQLLLDKKGYNFPQLVGNESIREYFKVFAIPQYVLIDKEGIIRHIYTGYDDSIVENVQELLKL